ncbi:MAG: hypothetical protein H6548_12135 [Chitinophagales bacterium]|nr:hypothetical protein [Chitinophagales bacterium]HPE98415.1 hypothetical protein [Chitinophagales bacterium]
MAANAASTELEAAGISLDVYGIIDEVLLDANASDPYDEIYSKLDQLNRGQELLQSKLDDLISEVRWMDLSNDLRPILAYIDYNWSVFHQLIDKTYVWSSSAAKASKIQNFIRSVTGTGSNSMDYNLFLLNRIIVDGSGTYGKSLLEEFKTNNAQWHLPGRSLLQSLELILLDLQYVQFKGYAVLQAAQNYVERQSNPVLSSLTRSQLSRLKDMIENNDWPADINENQKQNILNAINNSVSINNFKKEYESRWAGQVKTANLLFPTIRNNVSQKSIKTFEWGDKWPEDAWLFADISDGGFIHCEKIEVQEGCVLIGAQFIKFGNRLAVQASQAEIATNLAVPVEAGSIVNGLPSVAGPHNWDIPGKNDPDGFFEAPKGIRWNTDYIDLPDDYVATGIKIYCINNVVGIKLKATKLLGDVNTEDIKLSTRAADTAWFPDDAGAGSPSSSLTIDNTPPNHTGAWADMHPVVADPPAYIVGGGVYQYGNRVAILLTPASIEILNP